MKKIIVRIISIFFVFSMFIPFVPTKASAASTTYMYAYVNEDYVRTRSCASLNCEPLTHNGSVIYLSSPRVVEVLDYTNEWAHITYNYWGVTYTGYMYRDCMSDIRTMTTDDAYYKELLNKGFPKSYAVKLVKIHTEHPNWNFEVSETNISLEEAVNNEASPVYKNLINTSNTNLLSTDPAAYSNGSYVQFEPGWYAPSKNTINYYMDPRNFLDNNSIFMFEQLSYNSTQTENVVQALLNGSFMEGSYSYNGQNWTYAKTFVEAGKKYGVSPIHLAARVIQEQGRGGSATINMNGGDGQLYYNYFNFNATGSTTSEIIGNALAYAKRCGWNNPHDAIFGGAEDLADGYITNGQDTLYYQKFNVVGGGRFWHQYMANVQAPYYESFNIYDSYYEAGLINSSFTFKIPVYSNMIDSVEIAEKSNNNNLSKLTFDTGTLYPEFNSSISIYTLDVRNTVKTINVNAVAADSKAKVSGAGDIDISKINEIKIIVTAEDGSTKEYKITLNKKVVNISSVSDIITNMNLTTKDNNISGFTLGASVDTILNDIKKISSSATVKIFDSSNKEIKSGIIATGQKISITLNGKENKYNVVVYGDSTGDGKISAADYSVIKAHILGIRKVEGFYFQAADTSKDGKVSAADYSMVKAHILNISKIKQ